MDIAKLGFEIDSSPAADASQNLDKLAGSAARAESGTAKMQAQVERTMRDMQAMAGAAGTGSSSVDRMTRAAMDAAAAHDRLGASAKAYMEELNALQDAMRHEAKSLNDVIERREWYADALKKGMLSQDEYTAALKRLDVEQAKLARATGAAADGLAGASAATKQLGIESVTTGRQVGSLMANLASGNWGIARTQLTSIAMRAAALVPALSGVLAVAGSLGMVWLRADREARAFTNALIASGHAAGASARQLQNMAQAVGASTGEYGKAREAMVELTRSGKLTAGALEDATRAAVALATVTGRDIRTITSEITELGRDPAQAVVTLADKYNILTLETYNQVKALQDQGRQEEAIQVLMRATAEASEERSRQIVENVNAIAKAYQGARGFVTGLWEDIKRGASTLTSGSEEDLLYAARGAAESIRGVPLLGRMAEGWIASYDKELASLREVGAQQAKNDREAGEQRMAETRAIEAAAALDRQALALDRQAQKQRELDELHRNMDAIRDANPMDPRLTDGTYERILAGINDRYRETATAAKAASDAGAELVARLQEQAATFGLSGTELERYRVSVTAMTPDQREAALAALDLIDALAEIDRATEEAARGLGSLEAIAGSLADRIQMMRERLSGASAAQIAYNKTVREAEAAFKAAGGAANPAAVEAFARAMEQAREALDLEDQIQDWQELEAILGRFGGLTFGETLADNIRHVEAALDDATDPAKIERMQRALGNMKRDLQQHNLALASQGVASLQQFAKEGTAAYTALGIAQDVLAYKSAVAAIANQGSGDPYTAFARIAAMIALMASIGIRVGGGGSAAPDVSAQRQASQGTGSVLGDASAKSESIARAVEITASATQQLVGINRGMLSALQSLQRALGAAGGMLARGAGDAQFAGIGGSFNVGDPFGGDPLGRALGKLLFGGSKKIVDQGIIIAGGALSDMINDIAVGAYQTVHTSGGLFRSSKTRDSLADVPDEFARQFSLVIGSIADTVREGATALGLLPADIEARMAAFRAEEMRISLKDLSAEEQQKEIEAVFSKLFDGLAGSVVPWIEQFQQVGEGLGETLVRVATQVQVAQEAFRQLGLAVDETDPERFAQLSDGLIQAAGGLEEFMTQFQSFVASFAPESHKFMVAQTALTSAFEQANLVLPATRQGMWELMQSLDATTESGREQIATLLRLAETADQYYSALEKLQDDMVRKIEGAYEELSKFGVGVGDPGERLRAINQSAIDAVNAANLLAKAAGQQGAAEWQLALIHRVAAGRAAEAIAQLMQATQELVAQFYGDDLAGAADSAAHAVSGFGSAMSDAAQRASDAIRLLLGDLSPLNDQMKLQVALDALSRGEVGREDVLEIGRRLYASSQAYTDLFNRVMRMNVPTPGTAADYTGGMAMADIAEQVTPEQRARERMDLAMQIGQNVATLANAQGEEFSDIADMLGLNLGDIAEVMGLSNDELTAWLENLVEMENRTPDAIRDGADRIIDAMYDIADGDYLPATPPASPYVPEAVATQGETAAEVRDLLRELIAVVREGDGEVVGAVREVVGATESVSREIRDSDDRNGIYGRRNERTMSR